MTDRSKPGDLVRPRDPAPILAALRSGARPLSEEIALLCDRIDQFESLIEALLPDETGAQRRERLLTQAEHLSERWPDPETRPPLYGTVVGVKDIFHARNFPTRAGSRLPPEVLLGDNSGPGDERNRAAESAASVHLLEEAGALVLGKVVTTEFAYFGPGPTRNPWNTDHTPGGSSSGSAAAVAAGFCHIALGTQTIGSISRPATFCGLAGYKPSFGRISTAGVIPFSPNADHIGLLAPSARTLAAVAPVLTGEWNAPAASLTRPPRDTLRYQLGTVLIPDDAYLAQADDDARRGLSAVQERLQGLGVTVQRVNAFADIESINAAHQDMIAYDFARVHAGWYDAHGDLYHKRSRELIQRGRGITDDRHALAVAGRKDLRVRLDGALRRHAATLWIAPATVGDAPPGIQATGNPIMNLPWTYAGVPTVSLPLTNLPHGTGDHGLPLGIQIAAPFGEDESLVALAILLEEALR